MNRPQPNSIAGRIRSYLSEAGRPVTTREIADKFNLVGAIASAQLCQLRRLGLVRNQTRASTWGNRSRQSNWIPA